MEEIASQFREELQEIVDRYKTRLSVPRIMHVAQDVFHKNLSVKYNPELHSKVAKETMKEMAKEYANHNRHYEIAKRENGADYAKEVSSVTIEQAYLDGQKDLNDIHSKKLIRAEEIIKDFILMAKVENLKNRYETVDEAEQFLSEV